MAVDRRCLGIWIASMAVMIITLWKTGNALSCYACEKSSEKSYADAENLCNIASLGKCEDATSKACMVEGFQRDSIFHVVKRCVQECPVFVNSSAQLIRCCATDACNDFVATATDSDGFNIPGGPATEEDYSTTTLFAISTTALDPPSSSSSSTTFFPSASFFPFPSTIASFPSLPQPPRPIPPPSTTSRIVAPGSDSSQVPGRNPHQPVGTRFNQQHHHHSHQLHRSQFDGAGFCRGSRSGTVRSRLSNVLALCSTTALLVWSNW